MREGEGLPSSLPHLAGSNPSSLKGSLISKGADSEGDVTRIEVYFGPRIGFRVDQVKFSSALTTRICALRETAIPRWGRYRGLPRLLIRFNRHVRFARGRENPEFSPILEIGSLSVERLLPISSCWAGGNKGCGWKRPHCFGQNNDSPRPFHSL